MGDVTVDMASRSTIQTYELESNLPFQSLPTASLVMFQDIYVIHATRVMFKTINQFTLLYQYNVSLRKWSKVMQPINQCLVVGIKVPGRWYSEDLKCCLSMFIYLWVRLLTSTRNRTRPKPHLYPSNKMFKPPAGIEHNTMEIIWKYR